MVFPNYRQVGGIHSETAALANAMACAGITAPHTGKPYSEAMILGVGGGLGAGYILWEFKDHDRRVIVLGFRKDWQYPVRYMQTACARLGVKTVVLESGGAKAARKQLDDTLAAGKPAIMWVDHAHMIYLGLPESQKGYMTHIVVACGADGETVLIDDLARQPFTMPHEALAPARAIIGSVKNRLLLVEKNGQPVDLQAAITAGIQDCIAHLSSDSDSFSLPALRKWARLVTDTKNKKGWPVVFSDGKGLYGALKSIYEFVRLYGGDGGTLRGLYADFLDEAAPIIENEALHEVAVRYRDLAERWNALADAALPDEIEPLRETKALMQQKHAALMARGGAAVGETQPLNAQLDALEAQYHEAFPLEDTRPLFETIGGMVKAIYEAEAATLAALQAVHNAKFKL